MKKDCFFINPNNSLTTYFSYHNYHESIFIKSFDDLNKKIMKSLNSFEKLKINYENICLDSQNVSNNIYNKLRFLKEKY